MKKILVVAKTEYLIAVTSKAFLLGVVMMPIFMGGAIVVQHFTRDHVDLTDRRMAVVDQSNRLFPIIASHAEERNRDEIYSEEEDGRAQVQPQYIVERVEGEPGDAKRLDLTLSQRVEEGDLFAFAIIEADVFDASADNSIHYHSQTPSYTELADWLDGIVNDEVRRVRLEEAGISAESLAALTNRTSVRQFGLVELADDGEVADAKEENEILTVAVPMGGLMLMFMMIMSVAPAMLNNVLEEKMQKISEFLVSSITPFQLMMGKLAGAVGVGLTLSTIYLGAAYSLANHFGVSSMIPTTLYLWFVFYLFVALIIYGSIFSAIGAACSEIRDAQSLMTPVMLIVIIPMLCIGPVFHSPSSVFSRSISLFPPATPLLMFARIAIPPGPAAWEIALGAVLTVAFAVACVWAAGKVFRIGVLSQGQAPSLGRLVRWVFAK